MKKTIAILLVAIMAVGSVFAALTGSAEVKIGADFDEKTYGFLTNASSVDVNFELTNLTGEAVGEGDIYASIKGSLVLEVFTADDWESSDADKKPTVPANDMIVGDWADNMFIGLGLDISEAKIAGQNWYVSILGAPGEPDFAESAIDTWDSASKKYGIVVDGDGDTSAASVALEYYDDTYGLEVGVYDYVVGGSVHGTWGDASTFDALGYFSTPTYDFNGLTLQVAAAGTAQKGAGAIKGDVSAKVGYANDTISTSIATDMILGVPTVEGDDVTFDADVAANFVYDFLTFDAYYATNVEVDGTATKNLLSFQVATDLNSFDVPLTITAGIKDAVNATNIFGEIGTTVAGFGATLSADVDAQGAHDWNVDAELSYDFDIAKITGAVGYGSDEKLNASLKAESSTLVPGATITVGWVDAKDLLANDSAEKNQYGYLYAGCKIEF